MTLTDHLSPLGDKRVPAALVAAFLLQLAAALFWAGAESARLNAVESTLAADQAAIARVAVLEQQVADIKAGVARIEQKLDRAPKR